MQTLHVELIHTFQVDKPHGRARRRFGDRLRVTIVVLLCLHIGPYVFRRHRPHLVSLILQRPSEMVCPAASFHGHHAPRQIRRELDDAVPAQAPPQDNASCRVEPGHAAAILAQVDS